MAISRFKTSTLAQGLPKYQKLWDGVSSTTPYELLNSSFTGAATTFQAGPAGLVNVGMGAISNMVVSIGGSSYSNAYKYFQSGSWQTSSVNYPVGIQYPRVISDGAQIISFGGELSGGSFSTATYKNTGVNTAFTAGTSYPTGVIVGGAASGPAISGKYYNVGGIITSTNDATNLVYSTTSAINGWSAETNYPSVVRSNDAVSYGGYVYALGGYNGGFMTQMYRYSGSGAWSASTSLPYQSADMAAVAVAGVGIFAGVNSYNGVPLSGVRFYKWNGSSWSITTKQPSPNPGVGDAYNRVAQTADGYIALMGSGTGLTLNYIQTSSWT